MRIYLPILLVATAVIAGLAVLWLNRPTAEPAAPETVFSEEAPVTEKAARPKRESQARQKPLDLDLELESEPETDEPGSGDVAQALADEPHLKLDLKPDVAPRPESEKLRFFDRKYGTQGFTTRRWLNDRIGVQGGIGYTLDERDEIKDREPVVGVGVVLTF